jgi:eukaryotic-like serine/threonine-protein kinase
VMAFSLGISIAWNVRAARLQQQAALAAIPPPPPKPEKIETTRPHTRRPPPQPAPEPEAAPAPQQQASSETDSGGEVASAEPAERPHVRKRVVPRPGRVTVRVNPWAEVIYEGRNYGVTPVAPITVPAGTATFTLRNKQLGVTKRVSIRVPSGGEVVLKADLIKARRD